MELLGTFLAGLGLYFAGIKGISSSFNKLAGDRLRRILAHATKNSLRTTLAGTFAGLVTQSPVVVMFMTMSMVTTGVLDLRRALILTSWSAVGTGGFILLASIDMHLLALYLLGSAGICYGLNLDQKAGYQHLIASLLGISLLFLGLSMIKSSALPLRESLWFSELLNTSGSSIPLLILLGVILGLVLQSVVTVSVIVVAITAIDLLDLDKSLMIILGSNIGSLLSLIIINRSLSGASQQILLVRFWVVLIGASLTLGLFFIDRHTSFPALQTAISALNLNTGTALGIGFLVLQVNSALAFSIFGSPLFRLAERVAPPDPKEELSKPAYISAYARQDPEAAVDLTEKEIERLILRLPSFLDSLRPDDRPAQFYTAAVLHAAGSNVLNETSDLIETLIGKSLSHATLERLLSVQARNDLLKHLQDSCYGIERTLSDPFPEQFTEELSKQIVEGLHAILSILAETVADEDDPSILLMMTNDRSALMTKIRSSLVDSKNELSDASKTRLFEVTTLFERVIWLAHRYAQFLARAQS